MKNKRIALCICLSLLCLIVLFSGCKKSETKTDKPEEDIVKIEKKEEVEPPVEEQQPQSDESAEKVLIGKVVNVDSTVNIRSGPSTESDVLGQAEVGEKFTVLKEYYTSEWHKIEFEGAAAYIFAEYLEVGEAAVTD